MTLASTTASAPGERPRVGLTPALLGLGFFIALAIGHTWPLATAPGVLSRNDTADTILHEWIMAWVAHQTFTNPLHLFDANIFYPERYTLAYSDHLFVPSMMAAPMLWAGASPVLAHNLVLLAAFALTGWTTSLVLKKWTGSWPGALVGGCLVAFNSFTLTRLPQIQDLHFEFFPLALFALDRLLVAPSTKGALQLAGWYLLQALAGTYLMVFTAIALVTAALARAREVSGARFQPFALRALIAAAVVTAALTPFLLPYYWVSRSAGLSRSLEETARYSAELTDYLAAVGHLHVNTWSRRFFAGDAMFPGVAALILAAVGIVAAARRDPRARMVLVLGAVAFALSFGPSFPPYRWLYRVLPILTGIRGAVRFGQIVLAAIGMLAAYGVAAILRRLSPRAAAALTAGLLIVVNAETFCAPMGFTRYGDIPPVYDALNQMGRRAVLAWFPFFGSAQFHMNAPFMLVTTRTWQPMVNGYSGFKPASYYEHVARLATFPDAESLKYLGAIGVTHVLVDSRNMRPEQLARLGDFPQLHLWVTDGNLRIYFLTS